MKKKLSLFLLAFIAMAAYAVQLAVNATKSVTELTVISEATTWDFSKLTINKESARYNSKDDAIKLDENTTPSINDEVIYADYADADITIPAEFNADAIAFKGQYPIRKNKYSQNGELHFKTSVPGNIIVKFSDTGSSASATAVKRYLVVNGEQTDYWASRENNGDEPYAAQLNVTTDEIAVPAGDVVIKGTSAIQVSYISFTPSEEPQPAEASYYVVGTMNDWTASDAYKLAPNAATQGEYMTTLQLAKDDEFKVIKVEGETTTWYPDGMDNNLKVEVSGEYNIYFRPDGQGGQDWYNGYIYLALKDEPAVSYTVHLDEGQVNGTVEADKYEVAENEQVLLKVTPNENYEIDQVSVRTVTGAPIDTRQITDGDYNYSFVMPGEDVYVSATFKEQTEVSPYEKATSIAVGDVVVLTAEGSTKDGPYAKELSNLTGKIGEVADYTNVPTGTIELTVEAGKQDGTFAFKCSEGKYLAANNSNELPLKDAVENASSWTVTWTEGVPIITNVDQTERVLQYNSGSPRFACYKGTQKAVTLWKKVGVEPQPLVIESMVIVGDFLGLENTGETSDPNWDPANGWQMTQSEENPAIWTYVKEGFEAEAKKYEFKATANGNWKDYVLPARTNADFIFGTEDYPAGTYDLTFTVNTDENILSLDVEKAEEPVETYTATFTTNLGWKPVYAYAYNYTPADEAEGVQEHIYVPVEWPGTPMTLNAETGVYEVAIESAEEPNLIIFNDGTKEGSQVGINQTPNWEFENGKAYDYSTQPFKVTFNTDKWENVWAYTWTGKTPTVEWPGVAMKGDKGVYTYEFEAIEAPDSIIFNNGIQAEVKEQTGNLPFVDGMIYSLTEEKTTAWAGDPEEAISTTTGITIPAKAFEKADVQAEKIIHIVAKEISTAAPAKGFNSDVAELKPTDIAILRNEEPFDKVLIEETAIQVVDDGYQFVADNAVAQEITDHGFIIKPLGEKLIGIEYVEVEKAKAPAPVADIVYDFAAAAAAGENPDNLNGSASNGAVFYGWENEGKTYSKRQDYKGYANYTGTNLPAECHVWRRGDRINNNVADGGLKCPNQKEMAINGLAAGKKVVIEYTGEGKMLYATGYDPTNATAEPNTVAIVGDGNKAAISGTTEIASGDPIHIVSTDAGYFVFRVLRGMVITKITISDETPIDPATVVMPKKVTVAEGITNGTVKVSQAQACAGDEVTVTTTPADGFKLEAITVTGVNTNEAVTVTDGKFTMIADDVTVSATFADTRVIYDFAAAAAAGENPENLNGSASNGAVFYGWENEGKTYSKRQDYKGYANYTGTNLPAECHVWRRGDRINNNVADGGLKCPNQKEMAINGLSAGSKVVIEYTGEGQMLYATGYDPANATAEPNTVAIVGDGNKAAISGTTAIPSGTPIHIVSTDAGYFVFRVLRGMVITKITISEEATPIDPATVVKPNKVTLGTSEGGTVKVSQAQAFEGDKVYATFTPNDGYKDSGIVPTIKNDADEDVTASITFGEDENGSYLVMPAFNITVSVVFQPQPKFYIIGGPKEWKLDDMTEMTFNATTQAYEFEYAPTEKTYFAFADKQFTADEAAAEGAWDVFNSTNRYALGTGDVDATLNEAVALQKVNGAIVLKPVKDGTTYKISVAEDLSTVTITGEAAPEAPAKYYLVGSMTDWEIDANYELTPDNENAGQYKINKAFAANDEFKIVNSDKTVWYPDGMDNNYKIDKSANYTVYFKPAGGVDGWYYGFFNVVEDTSTGINGIDAEDADDNTPIYNLSGQKVTKSYKGVVIKNGKKYMQK